jgi:predicted flap endonuclease-1-like 5' DNA nuclease
LQEKVSSPRAPDDLTRIEGITAPINELLVREKITSFARLGVTSVTRLNTILSEGGGRFRNVDPKTWPKQALVAANSGNRA